MKCRVAKTSLRQPLLRASALAAVTGLGLGAQAMAQTSTAAPADPGAVSPSTAPPGTALGEVVVTARKVRENLQRAPVTVTVVSGKTLQELDIERPEDLAALTPGFHYEQTGARYFNKPTIRGLSVNSVSYTNQKAGVFVDGVAFAGDFGAYPTDDGEYDRVEVLKGPQSTAFGRGTLAGGINYVTKDPSNTPSLIASAEGRTNNETHDYIFASGPLIKDLLDAYLSVNYYNYGAPDGENWRNQFDGSQLGNESSKDAALKLKFTPTNWLTFRFRGSYGDDADGLPTFNFLDPSQATSSFNGGTVHLVAGPVPNTTDLIAQPDTYMKNAGLRRTTWRTEFNATADLGGFTLTSMTAYDHQRDAIDYGNEGDYYVYYNPAVFLYDASATPVPGLGPDSGQESYYDTYQDVQQEVRLTSKQSGPLRYFVGFDYFNWYWVENYAPFFSVTNQRTRSLAAFGNISYTLGDLTATFEARENSDRITYSTSSENFGGGYTSGSSAATFTRFLPRFTLNYQFTPTLMVYGLVSEGNHPGTFRASVTSNPDPVPVQEEILWNYEAGFKSEFYDHRLRINVAAYHEDWTNQQLLENVYNPNTHLNAQLLTNAGKSHIDGVEAEIDAIPIQGLNLRGTVAYDNAVFDKFCSPNYYAETGVGDATLACRSAAGNTLPQQPPVTASMLAVYDAPLTESWNYFLNGEWSYRGIKYSDESNINWTPSSNIVNFRIGVHNPSIRAELFVENATQEDAVVRASTRVNYTPTFTGYATDVVPQKPRQFGVKLTYSFGP